MPKQTRTRVIVEEVNVCRCGCPLPSGPQVAASHDTVLVGWLWQQFRGGAEETSVAAALELALLGPRVDPTVVARSWLAAGPADWGDGRVMLDRYRDMEHFLMARIEERQRVGGLVDSSNKLRRDLHLDLSLAQPALAIPRRRRAS